LNPCDCFLWDHVKDRMYRTNPHAVQEMQAEIEAVAEKVTGDIA
jgi:hypothetical protein